jgi:hypothetical protein
MTPSTGRLIPLKILRKKSDPAEEGTYSDLIRLVHYKQGGGQ